MARLRLPDWRDPRTRAHLIVWAGVAAVVMVAFAATALSWTSTKSFCRDYCHEMDADMAAYERSAHSNVSCYACHMQAGTNPAAFVLIKAKKLGELYLHFTNKFEVPLNAGSHTIYANKVRRDECVQCHNPKTRDFTLRPGIVMNHKVHDDKKVGCPVCHNRVAHPGIAAYEDFTDMEACFRCHTQEKGGWPTEPEKAEAPDGGGLAVAQAEEGHGAEGKAEGEAGGHEGGEALSSADLITVGREELSKLDLALTGPGKCTACHPKDFNLVPKAHGEDSWLPEKHHNVVEEVTTPKEEGEVTTAELAKEAPRHHAPDEKPCRVCHAEAFCDDCHGGIEMPHPADFREKHKELKSQSAACAKCHGGEGFCNRCHHGNVPTIKGWLAPTGHPVVAGKGAESCFGCHDPRFCAACHTRGVTERKYL